MYRFSEVARLLIRGIQKCSRGAFRRRRRSTRGIAMAIFDKTEAQAGGGIDRREPLMNPARTLSQVRAAELMFAMGVAGAAAALRGPYPTPSDNELTIEYDDTGDETVYRFADSAVARAGVAVLEQFKEEPAKGLALLMRWSALSRLINDARMQPYMRRACDGS